MEEKRKPVSVALDGPSGAGKSTVARAVAKRFGFTYVDTGAIYRTVALAALDAGVDAGDAAGVAALLPKLRIEIAYRDSGEQAMLLNGADVSGRIRTPEISRRASDVAALPAVRDYLLQMQREIAETRDVVMDGRDIGTVVLPGATVKIFMTASAEARAERRWKELRARGDDTPYETVLEEMARRDAQDTARATAPLRAAEDAVRLDTSGLDFEGSVRAVCDIIRERTGR